MSAFAKQIRPYVQAELATMFEAERESDQHLAFRRLERAHVLSQAAAIEHLRVHGHMLRFAFRQGLDREALGQVPRLLLAAPLSLVGLIPTGNTGGSNVSGLRPMPVPADLQQIIDGARARWPGDSQGDAAGGPRPLVYRGIRFGCVPCHAGIAYRAPGTLIDGYSIRPLCRQHLTVPSDCSGADRSPTRLAKPVSRPKNLRGSARVAH